LKEDGMMRLAGSSSETKAVKEAFERGETPDLRQCKDINSVADVLKTYLRNLPHKPLPQTPGIKAISKFEDPNEIIPQLTEELNQLPEVNYFLLKRFFGFLHQLASYASVNRMNAENLAIVFCPTLQISTSLISVMINHPEVFVY